jgi:hypothetical protein
VISFITQTIRIIITVETNNNNTLRLLWISYKSFLTLKITIGFFLLFLSVKWMTFSSFLYYVFVSNSVIVISWLTLELAKQDSYDTFHCFVIIRALINIMLVNNIIREFITEGNYFFFGTNFCLITFKHLVFNARVDC